MCKTTTHESFYDFGLHSEPGMYTYVGWTCHHDSFADGMPFFNEQREVILFIAGEVFPEPGLGLELKEKGHDFKEGNAEYLVHLYEERGERFFEELNGTFSGVLIDGRNRKTFLFNDRYGMERVFVHRGKEGFYFASEAKALLSVLPETRAFDPRGLVELVTCDCTLGNHSLYRGIEILPGGSLCRLENGELVTNGRYFDRKSWETQDVLSDGELTSRLIHVLPKIARKYVSTGQPVGISLTGGIDTRIVMACLDPEPGSLPCYSFGSMYRDTFDVKVARRVAGECGQTHHVLTLGEGFISRLPDHLEKAVFLSDGYLGLSGAAELYVNSLAREIAPVRITGNWGSELMRGVRAFKFGAPAEGILHPDLKPYVEETREHFERLNTMNRALFAAFQQAPHQSYGRFTLERSQVIPRTPFLDNDVVKLMSQASDTLNGFALATAVIGQSRPDLLRIPTDRGFLGTDSLLSKAFRRAYRQALFKAEYWMEGGAPDWLVKRRSLMRILQNQFLGRHKFYHLRQFLMTCMTEYVRDTLLANRNSEWQVYFVQEPLEQFVNDHLNGIRNGVDQIDILLRVALCLDRT